MGVRIYAYAVYLPQLDKFLDNSLADLLCLYVHKGRNSSERFTITDSGIRDDTFVATPQGIVRAAITGKSGRLYENLTEPQLREQPFLQQSTRQYLSEGSVYQSHWLLRAFSQCDGIDFIQCLIDGHRRWWIGSVLQFAETVFDQGSYNDLVRLFRKVLRGANCGYPIPEGDIGFVQEGLPFRLPDDVDFRIGRWSEDETFSAAALLSTILTQSPIFTPPPGPIGIAPEESQWHLWVHDNVASLLEVWELDYSENNVLTFIG